MSSLSASQLSVVDMATYMINSLYTIHCTIALYEFTDKHLEMLKAQVSCSDDDKDDDDDGNDGGGGDDDDIFDGTKMNTMNLLQIDAHLDTLTGEQTSFVLSNCGLALLCTSLQQANQVSLLHFRGSTAIFVTNCKGRFYTNLNSSGDLI